LRIAGTASGANDGLGGRLSLFKEREGHCRVPAGHKEKGFRLGQWVTVQRHTDTMSASRRQRLDALGFDWDPIKTAWEEGFRHLVMYKQRERHCRVPFGHIENSFRLGRWVSYQRKIKTRTSPELIQRLDELGFVWNSNRTLAAKIDSSTELA
jgi:Helicase associated domain